MIKAVFIITCLLFNPCNAQDSMKKLTEDLFNYSCDCKMTKLDGTTAKLNAILLMKPESLSEDLPINEISYLHKYAKNIGYTFNGIEKKFECIMWIRNEELFLNKSFNERRQMTRQLYRSSLVLAKTINELINEEKLIVTIAYKNRSFEMWVNDNLRYVLDEDQN